MKMWENVDLPSRTCINVCEKLSKCFPIRTIMAMNGDGAMYHAGQNQHSITIQVTIFYITQTF